MAGTENYFFYLEPEQMQGSLPQLLSVGKGGACSMGHHVLYGTEWWDLYFPPLVNGKAAFFEELSP